METILDKPAPMEYFPVKPGDWLCGRNGRVAKVRSVYEGSPGEVLVDLYMYSNRGDRTGRESPVMGGAKTFEPACDLEGWHRIDEPSFPIELCWVSDGEGKKQAQYYAGEPQPFRKWKKPVRKFMGWVSKSDPYKEALEQIAAGHNDAQGVAVEALGKTKKR